MPDQKAWEKEVRAVFGKMSVHKEPYDIEVNGVQISVFPDVFSPAYFTDSKWFAETVPRIAGRTRFLEIGTGTGIVALFVALDGGQVTATDINPNAVQNANHNFDRHGIKAHTYLGDLYEPLPKNATYDVIFWNHPFNKGDDPDERMLLKAGFDYQYQNLDRYIGESKLHLAPEGKLLLGTGNFALLSEIEAIAAKHGFTMRLLERVEIPLAASSEMENDYRIYELFLDKKN